MSLLFLIVLVMASMAAQDALGTWMVISEARGKPWHAATFDALGDIARIICTSYGAGQIIKHGWNFRSVAILVAMCFTSFFGTALWTKLGDRIKCKTPLPLAPVTCCCATQIHSSPS